jgi:hypothetical protein
LQLALNLWKVSPFRDQTCPCVHWFRWWPFWVSVVNCEFMKHKNSQQLMKLGMCTLHLLCHFWIKYYVVKAFIVECNLWIKLKNHLFPGICLYELFFCLVAKNSSVRFMQPFCIVHNLEGLIYFYFEVYKVDKGSHVVKVRHIWQYLYKESVLIIYVQVLDYWYADKFVTSSFNWTQNKRQYIFQKHSPYFCFYFILDKMKKKVLSHQNFYLWSTCGFKDVATLLVFKDKCSNF